MGNDGEARSDREYGGGPSVEEIHVDFLLWEELQASRLFAREFAKYCTKTSDYDETILPVQHSVMDDLGESDLIFRYRNQAGESVAILIEDKIGAPLQRQQAERYRKRGARGVPKSWDRFLTCIVAPERYLQWVEGFDVSLPLETIIEWLPPEEEENLRVCFKRDVLRAAIKKEGTVGPQTIDDDVSKFRSDYFQFLRDNYADLDMNPPKQSYKGETWFHLRHSCLPKGAWIDHKADRGYVDMSFPNVNAADLASIKDRFDAGMTVVQTGKSASIRLKVPAIQDFSDFTPQISHARQALDAALRLCEFFVKERERIRAIVEQ